MKRTLQILAVAGLLATAATAHAIPALQLYIEGATYDAVNETWLINSNSFDIWVLGDVDKFGTIYNVYMVASVYGASGNVALTPTTTAAVVDPSTPQPLVNLDYRSDADAEKMFAGTAFKEGVSTHAEFADADAHQYWGLGDFTLQDSNIGDYTGGLPSTFPDKGQINVYHVEITGYDAVHFDAFDHVVSGDHIKYVKAPFSHDAGTGPPIPEPGTLALMGTGIAGLALRMRRRRS